MECIPNYDDWKTSPPDYDDPPVCCECGEFICEDEIEESISTLYGGIICKHCLEMEEEIDVAESV